MRQLTARSALENRLAKSAAGGFESGFGPRHEPARAKSLTELNELKATLEQEVSRRQQLELAVSAMRAELAWARAELIGTQAGEKRARHQALHDALTSLPNRSYFCERLEHDLAYVKSHDQTLALMYLDLDGFKDLNDAHGHDTGDKLLQIVAARLTRAVRGDDMVSRLGGDEFACLLSGVPTRGDLDHLAAKLFDVVSAPLTIGKIEVTVRPSIGIAISPDDGLTADELIKNADEAMYCAKRAKARHAFADAIQSASNDPRSTESPGAR
jgi:diguanylate cyclase (GGDEF)-like protein